MSNDFQSPGAIKTYIVGTNHVHTHRLLEIQHNDIPILWAVKSRGAFKHLQMNITADGDGRTILASVKPKQLGGVRVMLGSDPDSLPKEAWAEVLPEGITSSQHALMFDERPFWWRRTRDKTYGASSIGARDFKLVDGNDTVLAVYVDDRRMFRVEEIGRIDYFVELGRELELFSLATILGIQDRIRRRRRRG